MDFYEVIGKRRTIRDFKNEEIPQDVITRIISAAGEMAITPGGKLPN